MNGSGAEERHTRLVKELERRTHFRVPADVPVHFTLPDPPREGEATIRNLGLAGARVDFSRRNSLACPIESPFPESPGIAG